MLNAAPEVIEMGACCIGLPMVAAVIVAVFRMVYGWPPTYKVSVGVVANVAAKMMSVTQTSIGNVTDEAPSGHVTDPAASEQ